MQARFFWATAYFNGGVGCGRKLFKANGVDYYRKGWEGVANNRVVRFNALWRMRSLGQLLEQLPAMGEATTDTDGGVDPNG